MKMIVDNRAWSEGFVKRLSKSALMETWGGG